MGPQVDYAVERRCGTTMAMAIITMLVRMKAIMASLAIMPIMIAIFDGGDSGVDEGWVSTMSKIKPKPLRV
jgi:hypothetical protein